MYVGNRRTYDKRETGTFVINVVCRIMVVSPMGGGLRRLKEVKKRAHHHVHI